MDQHRLWTKDFLMNAIINLFIYLVYYLLVVTITVQAAEDLKASPSEAGLASGIFILGALVTRILSGRVIDHMGRKKMLFIGLTFFLLTTFFYFGVKNLVWLLVIRFLHGAGFGIAGTATGTIAAGIIPSARRGEGTSYYAMSATLASALGPFLGMSFSRHGNFNMILILSAVLLTISFIAVFFLKVPEADLTAEQSGNGKSLPLHQFFEVKAIPISIISVLIGLAFSSVLSFLTSYTQEICLVEASRFFFIVYAAAILVSRPLTGILFDRKGENFVMYPAFLLFAVGLGILSQTHHGFSLLSAAAVIGLGYGTFVSSAQAIAIKVSPPHKMGLATSTFFSFIDGGVGIGPFLLGFLIPFIGLRSTYVSMIFVVIACSVLYYFLHGKQAARGMSSPFPTGFSQPKDSPSTLD